jgi:hypothetical protein
MPNPSQAELFSEPTGFVGWYRREGGKWIAVCEGSNYRECWRRLLDWQTTDQFSDKIVLAKGTKP